MAEAKKTLNKNFVNSKPVFSWQSPEFISVKRDKKWMVVFLAVLTILTLILYWQKSYTGMGLMVVAVLYVFLSNTKPKNIGCAVYNEGVVIDDRVYNYEQFKSFWLVNGPLMKIALQLNGRFSGIVSMPLKDMDPGQIRLFLGKYLPEEEEKREDPGDVINRLFRL